MLYLVAKVATLAHGVNELEITNLYPSGIATVVDLSSGLNSIYLAHPISPIIEIVWSMPPQAVPTSLSPFTTYPVNFFISILSINPLACMANIATHTQKAALELTPASIGTLESINRFIPFGLYFCDLYNDSASAEHITDL